MYQLFKATCKKKMSYQIYVVVIRFSFFKYLCTFTCIDVCKYVGLFFRADLLICIKTLYNKPKLLWSDKRYTHICIRTHIPTFFNNFIQSLRHHISKRHCS